MPRAGGRKVGAAAARPGGERWQQILDAAARIFLEKGYAGTSMQDVSSAVGLLKGSLYHYIDSKEDLLFHVLKDLHEGALQYIEQCESSRDPPLDRLRTLLELLVPYIAERAVQSAIFFRDFNQLPRERQRQIIRERDVYARVVRDLILEARRRGEVPTTVDPELAALTLVGAVSWVYHWYRPHGRLTPSEIGRQQAELLIAGLRGTATVAARRGGNGAARAAARAPAAAARMRAGAVQPAPSRALGSRKARRP
ncbi:MAG: TetR/AcrR family transcriptional regulator [Steroidobacteraceae bacterium]|nr:TetR/AcrR family transcriptional regulator [Steroidobacteraceae bacterium]